MRDRLIHGYFGVDYVLVWDTIESDIPEIISSISQILNNNEPNKPNEQKEVLSNESTARKISD